MNINTTSLATALAAIHMESLYPSNWLDREIFDEEENVHIKIPKEHFSNIFFNQITFYEQLIKEHEMV